MKNKISRAIPIIFLIIIIVTAIGVYKKKIDYKKEKQRIDVKQCNIEINNDGTIKVVEILKINMIKPEGYYLVYPSYATEFSLYGINKNNIKDIKVYYDGKRCLDESTLNVLINGKSEGFSKYSRHFEMLENGIELKSIEYGKHSISVEYTIDESIIEEYTNLSILKINNNKNLLEYNIIMNFPKKLQTFKLNTNHASVEKSGNGKYSIDMAKTYKIIDRDYTELKLSKNVVENSTKIQKKYNLWYMISNQEYMPLTYLFIITIITIILYILTKIVNRRRIIYKNNIKSTKVVLDPIFAESIIDGNIGTKELIMSCIMDLAYKKNIKILYDDDSIKINNLDGVNEYERKIIDLIFDRKLEISFKELEIMFNLNKVKIIKFNNRLKEIKEEIKDYFFKEDIYSKVGERILKFIKAIDMALIFNFIPLTIAMTQKFSADFIYLLILIASIIGMLFSNINFNTIKIYRKDEIFKAEKDDISSMVAIAAMVLLTYIVTLISIFESNILMCLMAIGVLLINIKILKKVKMHSLTDKGIIEYNKAFALKNYILEYSLMEQREIEDLKLWDRYIAYACAFGISIKINEKIDENAIKLNSFLSILDYLE